MMLLSALLVTLALGIVDQAPEPGVAVVGVVQDQTGAVLSGAAVQLLDSSGAIVRSANADSAGVFRFDRILPGTYQLRASFEGFTPRSTRVRVGTRAPTPQKIVLDLAAIAQEITVNTGSAEVSAGAASNVDAIAVDADTLDNLPVFDRDLVATMARFLDPSAIGSGGVTVVVNGMEVSALNVPASAVSRIRINQDPYSAEYSRPGRGRIEILTKPGSQKFSGEFNTVGRDDRFNATNAFATSKPPEQRRIFEAFVGGPVGSGGKTSFMVSADDQRDDAQAFIHAIGPQGIIQDTLPQVSAEARIVGSITRQVSDRNTFSIRPAYQYESEENRGAGGTTLASAATTFTHHEQTVTYTQQTIVTPRLVNQFQILFGHEREPTVSLTPDVGIVVAGAFTGGGGQSDLVRTEYHINLNESVSWIHGAHQVQAGFQLPDWSRRGFFDRTNFGGTFYFANLDAFNAGRPYSFTQQQGNGDLAFLEKQVGAYVKDDWQVRPGLTFTYGVRFDWQNYFHDTNNLAPRLSVAYAPGDKKTNVFRAGFGVFNDRSGPVVIADVLHSRAGGLIRYVITDPTYPNPFASAAAAAAIPPSIVQLAPDVQLPQSVQWSVGLDHQLQKTTTLSLSYTGARGFRLFRSRDINAPPPPDYAARPDPNYTVIRQIESHGRQSADAVTATLRGRVTRWFNGQMQYTIGRTDNDTNGINSFPANDYDLTGEWGRADFDRRHRVVLIGRMSLIKAVDFGVALTLNSGGPYTATLGEDVYNNGRGHARPPGVSRNTLEGDGFATLDLRASHAFKFGGKDPRSLAIGLDAFNLTNRVNYGNYVGTVRSPLFGQPVSARAPRQLQLSIRMTL